MQDVGDRLYAWRNRDTRRLEQLQLLQLLLVNFPLNSGSVIVPAEQCVQPCPLPGSCVSRWVTCQNMGMCRMSASGLVWWRGGRKGVCVTRDRACTHTDGPQGVVRCLLSRFAFAGTITHQKVQLEHTHKHGKTTTCQTRTDNPQSVAPTICDAPAAQMADFDKKWIDDACRETMDYRVATWRSLNRSSVTHDTRPQRYPSFTRRPSSTSNGRRQLIHAEPHSPYYGNSTSARVQSAGMVQRRK